MELYTAYRDNQITAKYQS